MAVSASSAGRPPTNTLDSPPTGAGEGGATQQRGAPRVLVSKKRMVVLSADRFAAASAELRTFADVVRLADDPAWDIPYEVLFTIVARKVDVEIKENIGHHRKPEVADRYLRRHLRGETLLAIAESVGLPPSMLCRVVLEHHLNLKKGKEVGAMLKDPSQLPNERLRQEVPQAVEADHFCGPHVDKLKHIAGLEYEELLAQKLRALGVPFLTENELRKRGDARTPDAWLPVPRLVRGRGVHWIDSKATFGDAASHAEYCASQFSGYLHRFDAGLVIYWFGYEESVAGMDPRVVVAEDLRADECELATCMPSSTLSAVGDGPPSPDPLLRSGALLPSPPISRCWSVDAAEEGAAAVAPHARRPSWLEGHEASSQDAATARQNVAAGVVRYDISDAG